ncbi:MAG TPA: hypothetical protein VGJ94_16720 [Syntrophorhabdaceae bacterium]
MKKGLVWLCLLLLLSGCSFLTRKTALPIEWPKTIDSMEALCDLNMAWKDMHYSGSMSLRVAYPDAMQMEVYGPFGETIVYLKKTPQTFLLAAGDEKYVNEKAFEERFDISLKDFIDDLTLRGPVREGPGGLFVQRARYRVVYNLGERESKSCWEGIEGRICITFLEARFNGE